MVTQQAVYTDYTTTRVNPDYSHHKLSSIEYVDGVNDVDIKDEFIDYSTNRTDLQMYYEKISILYGESSNRPITPSYPTEGVDLQPLSNEFEIVSVSEVAETGISIKAGDGVTATIQLLLILPIQLMELRSMTSSRLMEFPIPVTTADLLLTLFLLRMILV